jgi:hypothetical protein
MLLVQVLCRSGSETEEIERDGERVSITSLFAPRRTPMDWVAVTKFENHEMRAFSLYIASRILCERFEDLMGKLPPGIQQN